jgi:hypothetical protein
MYACVDRSDGGELGIDYSKPHASEWELVISATLVLGECGGITSLLVVDYYL